MDVAIGAANWLVGKVLDKLSNDLVAAYVASSELGLNSEQIKTKLKYMQGLLHAAQERDVSNNPGLQSLLEDLSKKADEAEDALDELHYFMIQDQLDGTEEAASELGDGLHGHALHVRHAARSIVGNWLTCFSCSRTQDDDYVDATVVATNNREDTTRSNSGNDGRHVGKLKFDRVAMSTKIKSVIESIHSLCDHVSDLLNKIPNINIALAFHNMDKVEVMKITDVSHISFSDLQNLNSLRSICFKKCDDMFSAEMADSVILHSVENLEIEELRITGELSSEVLKCFPAVSQFTIRECKGLELPLVEDGGLLDLKMLHSFTGLYCGKLFSRWPMGKVGGGAPFPTSLTELEISFEPSLQSMGLLSNLTSLTSLCLKSCEELTMDGFNPYITVNLKKFTVNALDWEQENMSIAGDLLPEIARSKLMHAGSFELEEFEVDSISAVLTAPVCSHLAASLHGLSFQFDPRATTFTEEQEQALQLLTSLKHLEFQCCGNLQSLPQGLRGLSSLKRLYISFCKKIQRLPPKEGLPASLETLDIWACSLELTEQAEKLKASDPWFSVYI